MPRTARASAFTGNTGPRNPPAITFASRALPTLPGSVDAPMIATESGRRRLATLRASDPSSRALRTARSASVGSIANSTCTVDPSKLRLS